MAKSKEPSKNRNSPNFNTKETKPIFLTSKAKTAFNCLWLAFIKAPIFWNFDPKYYIPIETDELGYAISSLLSQLASGTNLNEVVIKVELGQWHLIAFYSKKIISIETWYKTHNGKLLAIVKAFKTWRHYLQNCKHELFVLTDHNNLYYFIDTKNLSLQ